MQSYYLLESTHFKMAATDNSVTSDNRQDCRFCLSPPLYFQNIESYMIIFLPNLQAMFFCFGFVVGFLQKPDNTVGHVIKQNKI